MSGLMRVKGSDTVTKLVRASGTSCAGMRWFVEVLDKPSFPDLPHHVLWQPWSEHESYEDYAKRISHNAEHGVVHGPFQLGLRVSGSDARLLPVRTVWRLQSAPRGWDYPKRLSGSFQIRVLTMSVLKVRVAGGMESPGLSEPLDQMAKSWYSPHSRISRGMFSNLP